MINFKWLITQIRPPLPFKIFLKPWDVTKSFPFSPVSESGKQNLDETMSNLSDTCQNCGLCLDVDKIQSHLHPVYGTLVLMCPKYQKFCSIKVLDSQIIGVKNKVNRRNRGEFSLFCLCPRNDWGRY